MKLFRQNSTKQETTNLTSFDKYQKKSTILMWLGVCVGCEFERRAVTGQIHRFASARRSDFMFTYRLFDGRVDWERIGEGVLGLA